MLRNRLACLTTALMLSVPVLAPAQGYNNGNFYNGVRQGGGGGQYERGYRNGPYNDGGRYHQGGVGPGKGALIGAAAGGVLGGVLGGGLKGALIGGGAGAGIGAIAGKEHQNNVRRNDYYYGR